MNNAGRALQHSWNEVRALELELLRAHGEYKIRVASVSLSSLSFIFCQNIVSCAVIMILYCMPPLADVGAESGTHESCNCRFGATV